MRKETGHEDAKRQQRRDTGGPARQVRRVRASDLPSTPVRGCSVSHGAHRQRSAETDHRPKQEKPATLDAHAATDGAACVCAGAGRHEGIRLLPALRTRAFSSSAPRVQLCAHPAVRCAPGQDAPHRRRAAVPLRRRAPAPLSRCPAARGARPVLMRARRSCRHPCSRPLRACRRHRDCTTLTWKRTTAVLA